MAKHSSKMSKMFSFLKIFFKYWSGLIRLEWFLHHFLYPLNLRVTFNDIPPRAYRILKQSVFSPSTIVRRKLIQFMLHTRSYSEFYIYVIKLRICNLIFPIYVMLPYTWKSHFFHSILHVIWALGSGKLAYDLVPFLETSKTLFRPTNVLGFFRFSWLRLVLLYPHRMNWC